MFNFISYSFFYTFIDCEYLFNSINSVEEKKNQSIYSRKKIRRINIK